MKLKITLIFIFYCFVGEGQVTFQKLFGHPNTNVAEYVHDACMDSWGNLYVAGSNNLNTFNIAKVDSLGTICYNKTISEYFAEVFCIIYSSDSNIVVAGRSGSDPLNSYVFLIKMDTAASVLWSSFIPLDSLGGLIRFITEDNHGNFLLGGYKTRVNLQNMQFTDQAFVSKFSSTGAFIWYKEVVDTSAFYFSDCALYQNNYWILGTKTNSSLGNSDIILTELDTSGSILRSAVFGSIQNDYGLKLIRTGEFYLMACVDDYNSTIGRPHFIQIDSVWNIVQNKKLINVPSGIYSVSKYMQNSFLITANGPMLYVLDSVLDFQVGMNYGISGFNRRLHKAFAYEDGHIFAVGTNLQNPNILVLKTDILLNTGCYSYSSIMFSTVIPAITIDTLIYALIDSGFITSEHDSIGNGIWQESILCISTGQISVDAERNFIEVYPNPATELVYIKCPWTTESVSLNLYDFSGRNVMGKQFSNQVSIDISELPSGVYFYEVEDNSGFRYFGKLLKH